MDSWIKQKKNKIKLMGKVVKMVVKMVIKIRRMVMIVGLM